MPPADSSTEDTLDLKLPPEFLALLAEGAAGAADDSAMGVGTAAAKAEKAAKAPWTP